MMKRLMIALSCLTLSCSEPDLFTFHALVENASNSAVTIYSFDEPGETATDSVFIDAGATGSICFYLESFYAGYACQRPALRFVFENGKGYYCEQMIASNISEFCFFQGKDPFLPDRITTGDRMGSIFIISEEDFQNAREL